MAEWNRMPGFDLSGKRAVVVGCANPAGRAIAVALAEAGADVAVASATLDGDEVMEAKRIAKAVGELGRKSVAQGWDVTLPTNVQVGYKQVSKEMGTPSILVYNADLALARPIEKITDSEFGRVQAVNQNGAFYTARTSCRTIVKISQPSAAGVLLRWSRPAGLGGGRVPVDPGDSALRPVPDAPPSIGRLLLNISNSRSSPGTKRGN